MLLGREINAVRYGASDLLTRLRDQRHPAHPFLEDVLGGPKVFLVGSEEGLEALIAEAKPEPSAATAPA